MRVTTTKQAFTMIELIFVIVILGILGAIAIPKLSATRDDAEVSKMATNMSILISDLGSTFTSQGTLDTWNGSTNVVTNTDATTLTSDTTKVTTPVYFYNGTKQCIKFIATKEGNLTVSAGSDTSDTVCKGIQAKEAKSFKSYVFGGSTIKY